MKCLIAVLLAGFILAACDDATAPGTTITFRTDLVSCANDADIEITIDGESQGTFHFAPGSEWQFSVSPGNHTVKAQGETLGGGFVNVEREVTVTAGTDFTVLLSCDA